MRLEAVVAKRPSFGTDPDVSVTTLTGGVRCNTTEGDWQFVSDLPDVMGGAGGRPGPGAMLRASFGSCLAMGYKLRACRLGITIDAITITVTSQSALVGSLDLTSERRPGYDEFHYHVELDTSASEADIQALLNDSDALSPVLDAVANPTVTKRTVEIRQPDPSGSSDVITRSGV